MWSALQQASNSHFSMWLSFSGQKGVSLAKYCICRGIQEEEYQEGSQRCISLFTPNNFVHLLIFQNVSKILWNLHHIMHVDCRRRFAFGATIENTDTRIWFCCRQTVFVTQPFDFMKVNFRTMFACIVHIC